MRWYSLILLMAMSYTAMQAQTWKLLKLDVSGCTNIVLNPWQPGKLYFLHHGAIATTTDNGDSWEYLNLSLSADMTPLSITFDNVDPNTWYMPVGVAGLAKTTDGGRTFAFKNAGLDLRFEFKEVIQHPTNPNLLYILADGELRRSTDRGETWPSRLLAFNLFMESAAGFHMDTENPEKLYVYASGDLTMYTSSDGGETWQSKYLPQYYFTDISQCRDGSTWVGTAKSTDDGENWTLYKEYAEPYAESFSGGCRVVYDASEDQYIIALKNGTIFHMKRSEKIWTSTEAEFITDVQWGGSIHALYFDDNRHCLWVVYGDKIFLSEDDGKTFRHPRNGPYLGRTSIFATPAPNSDIVSTNSAYTTDNGESWIEWATGNYDDYVGMDFSPIDSNLILAGSRGPTAFTDKGLITFDKRGWFRPIYPTLDVFKSIKFNPHNPHQVCGGGDRGFWCVDDSIFRKPFGAFAPAEAPGMDTTYLTPLSASDFGRYSVRDFAYHPHHDGVYYLAAVEQYPDVSQHMAWIQHSADFGRTWRALYSEYMAQVHEIIVHPKYPDTIVVACGRGLIRSSDGGNTWQRIFMPEPLTAYVSCLEIDPRFAHIMYAGVRGSIAEPNDPTTGNRRGGICVSYDYGATWEEMPLDGLHNYSVNKIHYHENPRRLMISTSAGLYEAQLRDAFVVAVADAPAEASGILAVYPKPVSRGESVSVDYSTLTQGHVHFELWDALGRKVQQIASQESEAGTFTLRFLPHVPAAGMYILRMTTKQDVRTTRMIIQN